MSRLLSSLSNLGIVLGLLLAAGRSPGADDPKPLKIHMLGVGEYKPVESLTAFKQYLDQRTERPAEGIQQIVWALVTSPELRFNY